MEGLSKIHSGPFLAVQQSREHRGLMWIGTPELCDCCQEMWPTSWITFDGKRFLCTSCQYELKENIEANIECCDLCHDDFPLSEMTLSYNQILCKKCSHDPSQPAAKAWLKKQDEEEAQRLREKYAYGENPVREKYD
jgi:hypothetical protein